MIEWWVFEKEQPYKKGEYLICYDNHGVREVKNYYWPNREEGMFYWSQLKVIYWAELNYPEEEKVCSACNGSGYYDNTGSPKCGCCNGTGKVRE
jgi:hypothetical protein